MEYMRYSIFGVPADAVTADEALKKAEEMLSNCRKNIIFTPNPEILLEASRSEEYRAVLRKADLALPDGVGLVFFGRLLGLPFKERVSGVDFMLKLCELAAERGQSVFLLGGRNGATEKTALVLKRRFPALKISGWSENPDLHRLSLGITKAKPMQSEEFDIIFVALGAPKQEKWIVENIGKLPSVKIAMAVGGAFDMISGDLPRAPVFLRKAGLEWLWRLAIEPKKRWRRIFRAVIIFPIKILINQPWRKNI